MSKFKSILLLGTVSTIWTGMIENAYGSMNDERKSKYLRHQISDLKKKGDPENKIPALQEQLDSLASQIQITKAKSQALAEKKKIEEGNAEVQRYIADKSRISQIATEKNKKEQKKREITKFISQLDKTIRSLLELKDGRVAKALELCENNTKLIEDFKESLNLFFIDSMVNTPTINISVPIFQKLLNIFFGLNKQLASTRENLKSSAKELSDTCTNFEFIGNWIAQVQSTPLKVQPRELNAQSRNLEFLQSLLQNYTAIFDKEQKILTDLKKNIFSSVNSAVQEFFSEQQKLATQILLGQNNFINYLMDLFAESELKNKIASVCKDYSPHKILKALSDEITGKVFEFSNVEDFETKFKALLSLIHNVYLDVETMYSNLAEPTNQACKIFLKHSIEKEPDFSNLVPILDSLVDSEPDAYKRLIGDLIANKNSNEARDLLNKLAGPQILFSLGCFNPIDKKLNGIYAAINEVLDELAQEPRATADPNPTNIAQEQGQGSDEPKITDTERKQNVSSEDQTMVSQKQPK